MKFIGVKVGNISTYTFNYKFKGIFCANIRSLPC